MRRPCSSNSRCAAWRAGAAGGSTRATALPGPASPAPPRRSAVQAFWRRFERRARAHVVPQAKRRSHAAASRRTTASTLPPRPPLCLQQQQQDCDVHGPRKPSVAPLDASPASNIHVLVVSCLPSRLLRWTTMWCHPGQHTNLSFVCAQLQVDDERLTRMVLSGLLMKCGYRGELLAGAWLRPRPAPPGLPRPASALALKAALPCPDALQ